MTEVLKEKCPMKYFIQQVRFHDNIFTKVKPVMVALIYNANASVDSRDKSMINNRTAPSLLLYFS